MELDPAALTAQERYKLTIGLVVPRPIAWMSTVGADGSRNLAPMSYFNAVQSSPFIVLAVGVGTRLAPRTAPESASGSPGIGTRGAEPKDTLRNVLETREFVVNVVTEDTAEAMNATSGDYPYGASEWEAAGLEAAPSVRVQPPRVARSPVAFECALFEALPLTRSRRAEPIPHGTLLLGEVVHLHVAEGILDGDLRADVERLRPVARLGGPAYWRRGEVFRLERPRIARTPSQDG